MQPIVEGFSLCVLDLDNGLLPSSFDGRLVVGGMTKAVRSCVPTLGWAISVLLIKSSYILRTENVVLTFDFSSENRYLKNPT